MNRVPIRYHEPGAIFAPGSEALVDASFDALVRAQVDELSTYTL